MWTTGSWNALFYQSSMCPTLTDVLLRQRCLQSITHSSIQRVYDGDPRFPVTRVQIRLHSTRTKRERGSVRLGALYRGPNLAPKGPCQWACRWGDGSVGSTLGAPQYCSPSSLYCPVCCLCLVSNFGWTPCKAADRAYLVRVIPRVPPGIHPCIPPSIPTYIAHMILMLHQSKGAMGGDKGAKASP